MRQIVKRMEKVLFLLLLYCFCNLKKRKILLPSFCLTFIAFLFFENFMSTIKRCQMKQILLLLKGVSEHVQSMCYYIINIDNNIDNINKNYIKNDNESQNN